MALLFVDGFDDRGTGGSVVTEKSWNNFGWTGAHASTIIEAGEGRLGTNSYRLGGNNLNGILDLDNTDATIYWGMAIKPIVYTGSVDGFLYLYGDGGGTNHLTFNVESDGSISVRRGGHGGTELGRTATGILTGVGIYDWFEFKLTINDTTGAVQIWKNTTSVLNLTSQDTKNGGTNSYIDRFEFQGANSFTYHMDDLYVGNTSGSTFTDVLLKDVHVETVYPDTEGTTVQWTPSAGTDSSDTIDEADPSTTDYNSVSSTAQVDEFNMQHMGDNSQTVYAIAVSSYAQKDGPGSPVGSFRHRVRLSGNTDNSSDFTLGEGWGWYTSIHDRDPAGSAWTGANVDATEIGYESR